MSLRGGFNKFFYILNSVVLHSFIYLLLIRTYAHSTTTHSQAEKESVIPSGTLKETNAHIQQYLAFDCTPYPTYNELVYRKVISL